MFGRQDSFFAWPVNYARPRKNSIVAFYIVFASFRSDKNVGIEQCNRLLGKIPKITLQHTLYSNHQLRSKFTLCISKLCRRFCSFRYAQVYTSESRRATFVKYIFELLYSYFFQLLCDAQIIF